MLTSRLAVGEHHRRQRVVGMEDCRRVGSIEHVQHFVKLGGDTAAATRSLDFD